MRKLVHLFVVPVLLLTGCNKRPGTSPAEFEGDIHMITPFVTDKPITEGKLYLSKGRLRVDLGPMVEVYTVEKKKGWRMFPELREYGDIGAQQVSTFLLPMTNGSPCPGAEFPAACKMAGKERIDGRPATKWELVNQHGERIYLWTDDRFEVPVRWYIENVRYYLTGIHEVSVPDSMFDLPPGYNKTDRFSPTE